MAHGHSCMVLKCDSKTLGNVYNGSVQYIPVSLYWSWNFRKHCPCLVGAYSHYLMTAWASSLKFKRSLTMGLRDSDNFS